MTSSLGVKPDWLRSEIFKTVFCTVLAVLMRKGLADGREREIVMLSLPKPHTSSEHGAFIRLCMHAFYFSFLKKNLLDNNSIV